MRRVRARRAVCLLAAAALTASCFVDWGARLRARTYPPDFHYISTEQLQSAMWQLADSEAALDRTMRDPDLDATTRRRVVIDLLGRMQRAAEQLGPGALASNHPRVSRNVDAFRRDLRDAREAVEREPPSYFLAGSVSGACMHCHAPDR
jgi:hypothetical protein